MNTSFTKLSRQKTFNARNNKNDETSENFTKVQVNVVGDWSRKKGPSMSFEVKTEKPKTSPSLVVDKDEFTKPRKLKSFNIYLTNDDTVKSVNEYNDNIPDSIEGIYKYDFNIMNIHDLIMKRFNRQKNYDLQDLERKLQEEMDKTREPQNIVERKNSLRIIAGLKDTIDNIMKDRDVTDYIDRIKPLIDEYNVIGSLANIVSFATNKKKDESSSDEEELPEDPEIQDKRHSVIYDFLEIARKYIQIDLIRDIKDGNLCTTCNYKLDTSGVDPDETGLILCPRCHTERISVVRSRFYKDNTRTNNSGNNYEDRANFEKVLMRYQGKQPDKPNPDLYKYTK